MSKKTAEIVKYINEQRRNGHKDGRIRVHMEVHGHSPEMLNNYFLLADKDLETKQATKLFAMVVIGVFLLAGAVLGLQSSDLTGAASWSSWVPHGWFGSSSYGCGDDYPADSDNVMDLSDCVGDTTSTDNYLFCYVNNTLSADDISPSGSNDGWYYTNVEQNISAVSSIDSAALLDSMFVLPYSAALDSYSNVDCFSWTHGTVRTSDWHLCNATASADIEPPNLVFYYTDAADGSNVSYGGIATRLATNSSYYLCYDELNCTTSTSACSTGSYCVGRLDDQSDSSWYPCDTTLTAPYYRCCTGGCDSVEMTCGEYVGADTRSAVAFDECDSDGTSGCCSDTTDCVYDSTCYNEDETIRYMSGYLGVGGEFGFEGNMTEYTFVCSDAHWCPEGFGYSSRTQTCTPTQAACYDASDSEYCNYIFGTDDTDTWEADTDGTQAGCIAPDSDATAYNMSCLYSGTYGGTDYYFYQDISWY